MIKISTRPASKATATRQAILRAATKEGGRVLNFAIAAQKFGFDLSRQPRSAAEERFASIVAVEKLNGPTRGVRTNLVGPSQRL